MQGILHSLQIGTLSTWLSVAGFGAVGMVVQPWHPAVPPETLTVEETQIIPNDFLLDDPGAATTDAANPNPLEVPRTPESPTPLPTPPELAPLAETTPLPEIPDLPPPPPVAAVRETSEAPRSTTSPSSSSSSPRPTGSRPSTSGNRSSSSTSSGSGSGGNSAASTSSRLAAGRMPAPAYPASAKRNNQTGTVVVEFTIGTDGRVISAYAKSASPWPSLNEAAVAAVRRWRFPPGGVTKTQRPIIFQLR